MCTLVRLSVLSFNLNPRESTKHMVNRVTAAGVQRFELQAEEPTIFTGVEQCEAAEWIYRRDKGGQLRSAVPIRPSFNIGLTH